MTPEQLRADLETLRDDLARLERLAGERAEALRAAELEGASVDELVLLAVRSELAAAMVARQGRDIAELECDLAGVVRGSLVLSEPVGPARSRRNA